MRTVAWTAVVAVACAAPAQADDGRLDWSFDVTVVLVYVAAAVVVLSRLWAHPGTLNPAGNDSDPPFFEWTLIHAGRIFTHGENPIGQVIVVGKVPVRVIGVVAVTSTFGPGSSNPSSQSNREPVGR